MEVSVEQGGVDALAECTRFLVSDPKKCTGCHSCMLVCSLVHEGLAQLSSSRIVIAEDRFGSYPVDIVVGTCRQCKDPACLAACPHGAISIDPDHYNVRAIDATVCVGCKRCIEACHFSPSRIRFLATQKRAVKCDLCRDAPYSSLGRGQPACVAVCPVKALALKSRQPIGTGGYEVNLRGKGWAELELPTD